MTLSTGCRRRGDDECVQRAAQGLSHHVGGENEDSLVFPARPLRVIQQIGVVLTEVPKVIPWVDHKRQQMLTIS